jgi:hypothetical protein
MKKKAKLSRYERMVKLRKRIVEVISPPTLVLFGFLVRVFLSFTSLIKAVLLSWGAIDGIVSNYLYKHEKFFPYQFIRYGRIVANLAWVVNPIIPIVWNIGDGIYSLHIYSKAEGIENLSRYGRILNGGLLALLTF